MSQVATFIALQARFNEWGSVAPSDPHR